MSIMRQSEKTYFNEKEKTTSNKFFRCVVLMGIVFSMTALSGHVSAATTPTCYASSCNYVDPNPLVGGVRKPTTCWSDAYNATEVGILTLRFPEN